MESVSLSQLADEQLEAARTSRAGRAALTVHGGHDHQLRQTLKVLRGRVRVSAAADSWEGGPGDLLVIPAERHGLHAQEDAVVLLTVLADSGGDR